MKTEKVMSVYDLQDEGKLGVILDGVEGLNFEKISAGACGSTETSRYHISMDEIWTGGVLLEQLVQFIQENEGTKIKFCSVEHTGQ